MRRALFLFLLLLASVIVQAQQQDFVHTDFRKADSVAAACTRHSLKDVRSLALKLTRSLPTEEEKFRALYTWVCNNIEYDNVLYLKNRQREKIHNGAELQAWNKKFNKLLFKHLLNKKKTVCTGYAYLLRELATHAGIKCEMVNGYGRTSESNVRGQGKVNHTWNAVQLHGKWYLCDATWSSGAVSTRTGEFIKNYDDVYFLTAPSLFLRNHYPVDSAWMLLSNKPTLNVFLNAPLIYKAAIRYGITPVTQQAFDLTVDKSKPVSFRFTSQNNNEIEKLIMYSEGPNKTATFHTPLYRDADGVYCNDIVLNSKGRHLVHVLVNDGYAFTYTVTVK